MAHTLKKLILAMMLKGMTAQFLIHATYAVSPGEHVLFHAAAGGVGSIACQWLNSLGAIVIGTVTAAVAGVCAWAFAIAGIDHWAAIIAPMVFFMAGFAITLPQVTAGAMMPFPERAGAASSVRTAIDSVSARICRAM